LFFPVYRCWWLAWAYSDLSALHAEPTQERNEHSQVLAEAPTLTFFCVVFQNIFFGLIFDRPNIVSFSSGLYFSMKQWLGSFAYQVNINLGLFVIAGLIAASNCIFLQFAIRQ